GGRGWRMQDAAAGVLAARKAWVPKGRRRKVGRPVCLAGEWAGWAVWTIKPTLNRNGESPGFLPGFSFLCRSRYGQKTEQPSPIRRGVKEGSPRSPVLANSPMLF